MLLFLSCAGIVVALCLSRILNIPFTNSTTAEGEERFHVYPPLRLVTGQIDDWYVDAKTARASPKAKKGDARQASLPIPQGGEVASFHYVESAEAKLLYALLSSKRTAQRRSGALPSSSAMELSSLDPSTLLRLWPPPKALGGYSYAPKDAQEAAALLRFINNISL